MKKISIFAMLLLLFFGCSEKKEDTKTQESNTTTAKATPTATFDLKKEVNFSSCATCHGLNGEKSALGVSNILKGQTKEDILTKLKGYKNGSYGANMKGIMSGQVKNLSDSELEQLADMISKF